MARPKTDDELKRNRIVTTRFTEMEYNTLEETAKQAKTTVAKYVHDLAVEGKVVIEYRIMPRSEDARPLLTQIGKIGSNLNQIARFLNEGGTASNGLKKDIHECIDALHDMRKDLSELWEG